MLADLKFGLHLLAKSPGFAFVAVLTLALGIGANTAIFSVVYAVLLRPLPYPEQDRLANLGEWSEQVPGMSISYPNFLDWRARQQCFTAIGVERGESFNYVGPTETERLTGSMASHEVFAALGVPALRGRLFSAADDQPGAERTVVVSEGFWKRRFGGRESAVGEKIQLTGEFYTIIGVLPDSFQYPSRGTELWAPLGLWGSQYQERGSHPGLYAIARLKPGVDFDAARAEMRALAEQLAKEYPASNARQSITMQRYTDRVFGSVRPALFVLLGAAGFVLLIACANVANLQLARAQARARELSIRAALGAGRGRVVRQLLTESLLLGLLGCAAGIVLGTWAIEALRAGLPAGIPRLQEIGLNGWALSFALGASLLTSFVFGLIPALPATRQEMRQALAQDSRTGGAVSGRRWRATLVVGEIALTCLLLVGTGLMLRTLANLYRADAGFRTERLVKFNLELSGAAYRQPAQRLPLIERTLARLAAMPGVNRVALASPLPLSGGGNQNTYYLEGSPVPGPGQAPSTERFQVDGGYFATLGIALVAGRAFGPQDQENSPRAVIVDTMFVEKNLHGQNPLGKRLTFGSGPPAKDSDWMQVVGVVAHIHNYGVRDATREQAYLPYTQSPPRSVFFVVRTERDPATLFRALRAAMREVNSDLPIYGLRTMDDMIQSTVSTERLTVLLLGIFSGLALLLAAVGLYGVISYTVSQRTREIGVRMALGATPRSVVDLVVRHGAKLAGLGLLLGLGAALGLTRLLQSSLYEVSPFDPVSFLAVALVLGGIGALACWLPARRATRIDPVIALRAE